MSDPPPPPAAPHAVLRSQLDRRKRLSLIWAIPIVSALIGVWLAWHTLAGQGPLITITFESASGLIAGQSHVRDKDVDMGLVEHIGLSKDLRRVVVTVRMNRDADKLLTDKAKFWVVRPRFFAGAVSGLETLVSGSYIELQPSYTGGAPQRHFVGLETPPVLSSDVPGHTFLLKSARIGNITLGSPVFFRDLEVGEVLGWDLGDMANSVTIHAFVRAPYDQYVHDDTKFWNASGASVQLGPSGLQFHVQSLRAVVMGGIDFETPKGGAGSPQSGENHGFTLYASKEAAESSVYVRRVHFVAYFDSSVSGLAPGSPVTLRGLKIGEVRSVGLQYDKAADKVVVPVHFDVEPERIAELNLPYDDLDATMADLVAHGLRASLDSASLLTGQKQITMDIYPNAPPAILQKQGKVYVLPTLAGRGENIEEAAERLVSHLNAIPFGKIGNDLSATLAGLNDTVNGAEMRQSLASLHRTLADADTLVRHLNDAAGPLTRKLPDTIDQLDGTARRLNALVASVQSGYGGNSGFHQQMQRLLLQLSETARSFRVLADLLARHPEALIRGRTDEGSP